MNASAGLTQRAQRLTGGPRRILGICGPPGCGKSTVAQRVCEAVNAARPGCAVVVPMDGFHLAQAALAELGLADRKGAPQTFDAAGYVALLRRLRDPDGLTVWAPAFHREIEEPIAGEIGIRATVDLVIAEGNYLLLADSPWDGIRPLLDEAWYLAPDEGVRRARLLARHVAHGRSEAAAQDWVRRVDDPNAALVAATAQRADLVLDPG